MAKVKHENWTKGIKGILSKNGSFLIPNKAFYSENSEHGKSTGSYQCPCCDAFNTVYLWSFSGSGKRCYKCNVLMTTAGGVLSVADIAVSKININDYANETN